MDKDGDTFLFFHGDDLYMSVKLETGSIIYKKA